jgi:putative Mn2+ efflux pump MntP
LYHTAFQISDYINLTNSLIAGLILSLVILYIIWKKLSSKPKKTDTIEISPLNNNIDNYKRFFMGIENEEKLILEVLAKNELIKKIQQQLNSTIN